MYADVRAGGQLLRIAHNLRIHDAKLLVSRAKFLMCGPSEKSDQYNATDEFDVSEKDGLISVQAPLNCSHESKGLNNLDPIARQLTDAVTLVNAPIMRVAKFVERPTHRIRTTQFFDAANMELLTIRTSVISLPIMAICVAVVLIASIAVKFITNNDVHEGLEAIVKSRQLMSPESSLLFNNDMVSYCQKQNHDVVSGCDAGVRENGDDIDS